MYNEFKIIDNPHITSLFTTFKQHCKPDFNFKGESHNFWELVCVTDGRIGVTADRDVFSLKKGQAILHNPMQFHRIYSEYGTEPTIIVFTFNGINIPRFYNNICEIENISDAENLYKLAVKSYEFDNISIVNKKDNQNISHLIFIKQLELFLLSLTLHSDKKIQSSQRAKNYSLIVKTLENNLEKRLTVSEIASLCNMSDVNVKKTFSKYAGVGIIEYFSKLKIKKAIELLNNGFSVKETALTLGYEDQNYFSTVFKRIAGHTPSQAVKNTNQI